MNPCNLKNQSVTRAGTVIPSHSASGRRLHTARVTFLKGATMKCSLAICDRPSSCHGYCRAHYIRSRRKSSNPFETSIMKRIHAETPLSERIDIWRSLAGTNGKGCWLWGGRKGVAGGYGQVCYQGREQYAHVLVWEFYNGPKPEGMDLDHLCRHRECFNPAHLEPVPHVVNCRRGEAGKYLADKTHCIRGHEFTPENTHYSKTRTHRSCRICKRINQRKYEETKKKQNLKVKAGVE